MDFTLIESGPIALAEGYAVEFCFGNGKLGVEWAPTVPGTAARERLIDPYRIARDRFLARVSRELGVNVAVGEML